MIIKRILGLIMLLTGLILLVSAFAGAFFVGDAIGRLTERVTTSLEVAGQSLAAAGDTLTLTRDSINDVTGGLTTAVDATASAARTLEQSRPLVDSVTAVTTQEVPEAIEGMQAALPNMIEVAAVIDTTLRTLSSIGIDQDIPLPFGGSFPLRFDLGIEYAPETSFDQSLRVFEASLTGLPESLRGLEDELTTTNNNLASLSSDLQATSDNLTTINARMGEFLPLLDRYIMLVDQFGETIDQADDQLASRLELLRVGSIFLLVALGLSQLAPIYLGWELLTGRRNPPSQTIIQSDTSMTTIAATASPSASAATANPPKPATGLSASDVPPPDDSGEEEHDQV